MHTTLLGDMYKRFEHESLLQTGILKMKLGLKYSGGYLGVVQQDGMRIENWN